MDSIDALSRSRCRERRLNKWWRATSVLRKSRHNCDRFYALRCFSAVKMDDVWRFSLHTCCEHLRLCCFHYVPSPVPLPRWMSRDNMDSSARWAGPASQLHSCCGDDIVLRWRHCVAASGILVGLLDIVNSYLYRWSPRDVRQKIRYKHRLWNRYIETMDLQYLTKYKKRLEIIFVE